MAEKKAYELVADRYHETTSKPGEPFTYREYVKGDQITLDAEAAERLIDAGAVTGGDDDGGEAGGDTKAPQGDGDGKVGDDAAPATTRRGRSS